VGGSRASLGGGETSCFNSYMGREERGKTKKLRSKKRKRKLRKEYQGKTVFQNPPQKKKKKNTFPKKTPTPYNQSGSSHRDRKGVQSNFPKGEASWGTACKKKKGRRSAEKKDTRREGVKKKKNKWASVGEATRIVRIIRQTEPAAIAKGQGLNGGGKRAWKGGTGGEPGS